MPTGTPTDDFFGTSYLSDPHSAAKTDYFNQLATLHSMLTSGGGGKSPVESQSLPGGWEAAEPGGFTGRMYGTGSNLSPLAANAQTSNPTNRARMFDYQGQDYQNTGQDQTGSGGGSAGKFTPPQLGSFGYPSPNMGDTTIPPDLWGLRGNITGWLQGQNPNQPNYTSLPGSDLFNLSTPSGFNGAMSSYQNLPGNIQSILGGLNLGGLGGVNNYASTLGTGAQGYANQAIDYANLYAGQAGGALGQAQGFAGNIAATGGAPTQQLLNSLNAIQQSGQTNIQHNLAQIREQYGASGTGLGSDVNQALALGATQGQQGIEAQQSSLLTSILQNAAQTQLGGVNALTGIGGQYGQLGGLTSGAAGTAGNLFNTGYGTAGNLYLGGQNANINAVLGSAGLMNTAYGTQGSGLTGLANLSQQSNLYSNQAQYQNFLRQTQQLSPQMQAALQFSTAYPGVNQVPSTGASLGSAALGAGTSIGGTLLTLASLGFLSDRNFKEDVEPVKTVVPALRKLPIYTWRYKGDGTRHIGPMAQDFKENFGVGDGHSIALVDVMGVLLQSMKELTYAH